MDNIKAIDWTWKQGEVLTEIEYESGEKELRENKEPPPTAACHDIAHFICAMHDNLEWDYEKKPNHIAEYNAVFVENMLSYFCYCYYNAFDINKINIKKYADQIFNRMKWFAIDHYKIHERHPSGKHYYELKEDFLNKVDLNIIVQHFMPYYQAYAIENLVGNYKFDMSAKINPNIDYPYSVNISALGGDHFYTIIFLEFESLYNYLVKIKNKLMETTV